MRITGIISEFNPFHLGHTVPMAAARGAMDGGEAVVCIMSGNCVQRGDLAIFRKLARAEAAVRCGADLVVELPVPYVLGSAERFAAGGVALLAAMGLPDTILAFGCETADAAVLTAVACALDTPKVQANIRSGMKAGLSYGAACRAALDAEGNAGTPLKTPNNLLGIEYLRAIRRLGVDITPLPVRRQGAAHDSAAPSGKYASATYIRGLLQSVQPHDDPWCYMPREAAELFRREFAQGRGPAGLGQLEAAVLSLLRLREPPAGGYLDDSEGLSTRIKNIAGGVSSLSELLERAKTKRYHLSRLRRLILVMCLGLTPAHRPQTPPYIRVLAANERGQALLRRMTKTASLPILSRTGEVKKLGEGAIQIVTKESAVTDLMALCAAGPARRGGSEWRMTPRILYKD